MRTVTDLLAPKSSQVWTVSPGDTVYTALKLMADKDVGALPVVGGGRVIGIISERDYARRGVLRGLDCRETPVREIMTSSLYSTTPDETLEHCMLLMINKHIRHLPVLDTAGDLVGIISVGDVLKAIIADQHDHIKRLELYQANGVEAQP